MLPYNEFAALNDRYSQTVILYRDAPIYVKKVTDRSPDGGKITPGLYYNICGQKFDKWEWVDAADEALSEGPFSLGYMNGVPLVQFDTHGNKESEHIASLYVTRIPIRRWKQGLDPQNLYFQNHAITFNKAMEHPGFKNMILGNYPTMAEACFLLGDETKSVAFNKRLAVEYGGIDGYQLMYRGNKIGTTDAPEKWRLGRKFAYMKEWLESRGVVIW